MSSNEPDLFSAAPPPTDADRRPPSPVPLTVSEVNRRAKRLLEAHFELVWVSGELSNVTRAASGHWYFSLKDDAAQVRCVMFRQRAAGVGFVPENGQQVEIRALPSMYEPRGEFQLGVEQMRRAGLGALFERFERLKAALRAEGLFDESAKRELPAFPTRIGVVTSLAAAALQDVLTALRRRAPMIGVVIYPTPVQGAGAAKEIARALDLARERREVDALIVCRGGGSIEDLWSFNEEVVARAVARVMVETDIVVVSGVGHESDFTITDFVADVRAPTPTAAAEMVSPDMAELRSTVAAQRLRFARSMARRLEQCSQALDIARQRLLSPTERLARETLRIQWMVSRMRQSLAATLSAATQRVLMQRGRVTAGAVPVEARRAQAQALGQQLQQSAGHTLLQAATRLGAARNALLHLDPRQVLARGYAIVELRGSILRNAAAANPGDDISVQLADGALAAKVTRATPG